MKLSDNQLLTALMATIPDRIFFKDSEGRFIFANDATAKNCGAASASDLIGKTDFDFFAIEHASHARLDEQQVFKTGIPMVGKIEREIFPNRREGWVQTTKVPLRDEKGEIIGICGISRDVTDAYLNELQVRSYAKELGEKQEQIDRELVLAREIQQALIMGNSPVNSSWNFTHRYIPTNSVGGDFFSIMPISDAEIGLLICDVTGHGVHAALITVAQRLLVDELHRKWQNPGQFLAEMNRRLCQLFTAVSHPYFVTACYCVLNAAERTIVFANAGHPLPLLVNRHSGSVKELAVSDAPRQFSLGMTPDSHYKNERAALTTGDQLLFYTDGLLDLEIDDVPQTLSKDVFLDLIRLHLRFHTDLFLDEILKSVKSRSSRGGFFDDVCLVGAELTES